MSVAYASEFILCLSVYVRACERTLRGRLGGLEKAVGGSIFRVAPDSLKIAVLMRMYFNNSRSEGALLRLVRPGHGLCDSSRVDHLTGMHACGRNTSAAQKQGKVKDEKRIL